MNTVTNDHLVSAVSTARAFLTNLQSCTELSEKNEYGQSKADYFRDSHLVICNKSLAGRIRFRFALTGKKLMFADALAALVDVEKAALIQEARGTRLHMKAQVLYCDGHAPTVDLRSPINLKLAGTYHRFGVGAIPRGQSGRKVHAGPMVDGPWAFAFGLSTCISDSKAHRDEDAAERATDLEVKDGDRLLIDNVSYTVQVVRGEFLELVANETVSA